MSDVLWQVRQEREACVPMCPRRRKAVLGQVYGVRMFDGLLWRIGR
jgi:hypothetical protein